MEPNISAPWADGRPTRDLRPADLPLRVTVDRTTKPREMAEMIFTVGVGRGQQFSRQLRLARCHPPMTIVPDGFRVTHQHVELRQVTVLAAGDDATVLIRAFAENTDVLVSAATVRRLEETVQAVELLSRHGDDGRVKVALWRHAGGRPLATNRSVATSDWDEIRHNYPRPVQRSLAALVTLRRPGRTERLMLWHGEPGTGKTTAVLALVQAWAPWCSAHVVTDPERMFEDADYLLNVLMHTDTDRDAVPLGGEVPPPVERHWKLLVAEDTDEYLRSDAKRRSGPALGRLLNATDGILGRGLNTLVLLTTNEEIGRLHPAVTRPGRCLAVVEFTRFTPAEASEWLGDATRAPSRGATLAELFHIRGGPSTLGVGEGPALATGSYL